MFSVVIRGATCRTRCATGRPVRKTLTAVVSSTCAIGLLGSASTAGTAARASPNRTVAASIRTVTASSRRLPARRPAGSQRQAFAETKRRVDSGTSSRRGSRGMMTSRSRFVRISIYESKRRTSPRYTKRWSLLLTSDWSFKRFSFVVWSIIDNDNKRT